MPDPIVTRPDGGDPEQEAVLADSVGLALLVVLETLAPAERLAFVLHDMFAVPFDEIAPIVDRSRRRRPAARQPGPAPGAGDAPATPDADLARQRAVVDAFFAAARGGDFDALVARARPRRRAARRRRDRGASTLVRGAETVARPGDHVRAALGRRLAPALVNGAAGVVVTVGGRPVAVMAFTVSSGRIVAIDALNDADRVGTLDLPVLDD